MLRFWQKLISFRKAHPRFFRDRFYSGEINKRGLADITWHGCQLGEPDWNDPDSLALAMTLGARDEGQDLHIMFNMYWEPLQFELPDVPGRNWYVSINTAAKSPDDIATLGKERIHKQSTYSLPARSVVVLISK